MQRNLVFPVKGTFYYAADLALDLQLLTKGTALQLHPEPENTYDPYAIQIWLPKQEAESRQNIQPAEDDKLYLIGYVPKLLSKQLSALLHNGQTDQLEITHLARHGKFIEIDCRLIIQQPLFNFLYLVLAAQFSRRYSNLKRIGRRLFHQ